MIRLMLLGSVVLTLFGCGKVEEPVSKGSVESAEVENPVVEKVPARNQNFGEFTKNSSTMTVMDTHAIWVEDDKKLKVYLTPSKITDEEKDRLAAGEMEFFVFSNKPSPDERKWQWYPYVVTEIKFESNDIHSDGIKSFYIMAYGIEAQNYTDNLNSFPSEKEKFEQVSFDNGVLSAKYFGQSSIMDSTYRWNIEI